MNEQEIIDYNLNIVYNKIQYYIKKDYKKVYLEEIYTRYLPGNINQNYSLLVKFENVVIYAGEINDINNILSYKISELLKHENDKENRINTIDKLLED